MIKVSGKLDLNAGITTNGPDTSRMSISFTSLDKDQWLAVVVGENKKNMDYTA